MHQFDLRKFVLTLLLIYSYINYCRRRIVAPPGDPGSCGVRGDFGDVGDWIGFGMKTAATWLSSLGSGCGLGDSRRAPWTSAEVARLSTAGISFHRGDHLRGGLKNSVILCYPGGFVAPGIGPGIAVPRDPCIPSMVAT